MTVTRLNAYLSNFNFVNYENGGLTNDKYITNPMTWPRIKEISIVNHTHTVTRTHGNVSVENNISLTQRDTISVLLKELEETDEKGT